jgi:hypothetical protein
MYYAKSINRGKFEIAVDGIPLIIIDPKSATRSWQDTYTSPLYSDGQPHTVTLGNLTAGKRMDVDAIQIAAPAGAGVDSSDGGPNYRGLGSLQFPRWVVQVLQISILAVVLRICPSQITKWNIKVTNVVL